MANDNVVFDNVDSYSISVTWIQYLSFTYEIFTNTYYVVTTNAPFIFKYTHHHFNVVS